MPSEYGEREDGGEEGGGEVGGAQEAREPPEPNLYKGSGLSRGLRTVVNAEAALILFQVVFCAQVFGSSLLILTLAPFGLGAWALVWLSRSVESGDYSKCTIYIVWKGLCVLIYGIAATIFSGVIVHMSLISVSSGGEKDDEDDAFAGAAEGINGRVHALLFVLVLWTLFGLGVWFLSFVCRVRIYLVRMSRYRTAVIASGLTFDNTFTVNNLAPPPPYPQVLKWETPPPTYDEALAGAGGIPSSPPPAPDFPRAPNQSPPNLSTPLTQPTQPPTSQP